MRERVCWGRREFGVCGGFWGVAFKTGVERVEGGFGGRVRRGEGIVSVEVRGRG